VDRPPPFDMPIPVPRVEPTPRWIRVRGGQTWLADSRRASLLAWYGPGMLPTYCFPAEDVRVDLLREGDDGWHDAELSVGVIRRAARLLEDLPGPAGAANGLWTFTWDGSVRWFEEALEIATHARDTSKRVDVVPSARHIVVEFDGIVLADSTRPAALFETPLPTRWYLPPEDVSLDRLEPSDLRTRCPYKGRASFFSVRAGGELHRDLAWTYPDPLPECPGVRDRICFFNERVDITIDGQPQRRPFTPWSIDPAG
jgi:uncharacterized protein (DUF427 family)